MTILTRSFALTLGLGLMALPAFAQETTTEAPATAPAEAPAAAPAETLAMGVEAAPEIKTKETAAVGEGYLGGTFEQWEQRCEKTADGKDPCQLYQLLRDGDSNSVAEFSIFSLPKGGQAVAGATIIAPLETLLTANLAISVDGGKAKLYPFTFCTQIGCVARIGFTAAEIAGFKKGGKASVTIVPAVAPEDKVVLAISLAGFTAGYDAVTATAAQ